MDDDSINKQMLKSLYLENQKLNNVIEKLEEKLTNTKDKKAEITTKYELLKQKYKEIINRSILVSVLNFIGMILVGFGIGLILQNNNNKMLGFILIMFSAMIFFVQLFFHFQDRKH